MVLAAQILNSTDFDGDGIDDYSLCLQLVACPVDGQIAVAALLATMTQTGGPRTGFLWDPETMQEGLCALTLAPGSLFKGVSSTPLKGMIGTAMVPGATRVLNRKNGRMEECTHALCPHAVLERTYDGSEALVNRAPHFGLGGFSGFVNAYDDAATQQAMYNFWSFWSEPVYSKHLVLTTSIVGPYRKSHLDTSVQSLDTWGALGYDKGAVKEYLTTLAVALEHSNFVPDLRVLGAFRCLDTLYTALVNASIGMDPAKIATHVQAEHAAILASSGSPDVVQESLRAGLGILAIAPSLPPPAPTPPTTLETGNTQLAIIIGVIIPVAIVLSAVLIALFVVRHRRRSLFGGLLVPSPGKDTTLVVTDIMGSTPLWETLAPGVMECALATHNAVVRRALGKWSGYEQATEGDSFLLAFHTPSDALGFALHLQTSLLEAAWEPALLQHPLCAPQVMGPSAALQGAGGSDGRFGLLRAAVMLAQGEPTSFTRLCSTALGPEGIVLATASSWENAPAVLAPPEPLPALVTAGSSESYSRARAKAEHRATARTTISYDGRDLLGNTLFNKRVATNVKDDPTSARYLRRARELLQSLRAVATGVQPRQPVDRASAWCDSAASLDSRGAVLMASTMAMFMRLAWTSQGIPAGAAAAKGQVTVFKGLRVRIGMHSGVEKVHVERSGTSGAGGMVLLTEECFYRLQSDRGLKDVVMLAMGRHTVSDPNIGPVCVYQAIERTLVPRLAAFEPLRGLRELQAGAMDAPVGTVTIAFANMVGLATLQAWSQDQAHVALDAYAAVLKDLIHDADGYLVDLTSSGLCIAAFQHPVDAVAWGAGLIEIMKHRQWDEELLSHELFEEVLLHEPAAESPDNLTPPHGRVLFRGPRIKIGIDVGNVQADVEPLTGRMSYHGKVMNRAARISSKASSGMQWCSTEVWEQAKARFGPHLLAAGIRGTQLGPFSLKGVTGTVKLVECSWRHGDDAPGVTVATTMALSLPLHRPVLINFTETSQPTGAIPALLRELPHSQPGHMASIASGVSGLLLRAQLSGALDRSHQSGSLGPDDEPAKPSSASVGR
ncbi:hypothetical protein FOA52_004002 [Chlamydomonas sp. UWO 241]|nr:hypothetical protein FOA52_004002 [Chlamydomonas sp. UWO 241]